MYFLSCSSPYFFLPLPSFFVSPPFLFPPAFFPFFFLLFAFLSFPLSLALLLYLPPSPLPPFLSIHVHCRQLTVRIVHNTVGWVWGLLQKKFRNLDPLRVLLVAIRDHHRNLIQATHCMGAGVTDIHAWLIWNCLQPILLYTPFSSISGSAPAIYYVSM